MIQIINPLTYEHIEPLIHASTAEGYGFIQKLWDEYQSGKNDFSEPGALLLGAYEDDALIAVGGVHPDPYLNSPLIGRIRHVYVPPKYRRTGLGGELVQALIAQTDFETFTLRTMTAHGHAFYEALGFNNQPRFSDATHWLDKHISLV